MKFARRRLLVVAMMCSIGALQAQGAGAALLAQPAAPDQSPRRR
jgi:hypothetical protein